MEHACISPPYQILVVGNVAAKEFHAACSFIQDEYQKFPNKFHKPIIKPLLEYKWLEYLCKERKNLGAPAWRIRQSVVIYANGRLIGDLSAMVKSGRKLNSLFKALGKKEVTSAFEDYMLSFKRQFVYMDISIGERRIGRLTFMLYSDELPETCGHFADLCRGETAREEEEIEMEEEGEREMGVTRKATAADGEGRKAATVVESMVWVDGEWKPKDEVTKRWGRCPLTTRNWDDLKQVIEDEIERACPEDERRESGGESMAAVRARKWYRDRRDSFHRWKRSSFLRVAREWWRREGRGEGEEEDDEGKVEGETWKRPVVHVGGVVVSDGISLMHVHGVVMPHEWQDGGDEAEVARGPQYATHVGGMVVHEGETVVHVQGIVDHGEWRGGLGEENEISLEPGHAVHVGGIVVHDGKSMVHVEGIVAHGGSQPDRPQEDGLEQETGYAVRSGSIEGRKSVVHAGDMEMHDERESGEKEKVEDGLETEDKTVEEEKNNREEIKEVIEEEGEINEETEKKEIDENKEDETREEENMNEQDKTEKENTEEDGETKEGDEKEQEEKQGEQEVKDEDNEKKEEKQGDDEAIKDADNERQDQKEDRDEVILEGKEEQDTKRDEKETNDMMKEDEQPQVDDQPTRALHIGGIVVNDEEGVVHIQGIVEHGQWEEAPRQPKESTHAMHIGGIVVHEGNSVMHVQGIVDHGNWDKPIEATDELPRAVHVGGIVVHEGENVTHVQGIVEHGQWEETRKPPKEPSRAVHVGGIVVHEGEHAVHIQGIVDHEQWDAEEEPPWPEPGSVVHIGRIVMHEGRGVEHVEGIVAQPRPESPLAPGHAMHLGGMVTHDGEDVMLCHGVVHHGEWDRVPEDTWERMKERGYVEHVGGIVTVDGQSIRHIEGIVNLRDSSTEASEAPKMQPCYKGSTIHRIVKGGWIQGGELNAEEMEVPGYFPDESFSVPFSRRGVLAMARDNTHHTNSTQFIITLEPTPWMKCEYVAFGQLIDGEKVLAAVEKVDAYLESPNVTITITNCGVLRSAEEKRRPRRRSTKGKETREDEEELPRVPTEIFVRNMLIAMMTDVAAEVNKEEGKKFLRLIRNAVTVEALLEVMDAMAKTLLTDLKKESAKQRRRLSHGRSMYGIVGGGTANFCGR